MYIYITLILKKSYKDSFRNRHELNNIGNVQGG